MTKPKTYTSIESIGSDQCGAETGQVKEETTPPVNTPQAVLAVRQALAKLEAKDRAINLINAQGKLQEQALAWWESRRPNNFCVICHLNEPAVNTGTELEANLAHAVAGLVRAERGEP